MQRDPAVITAGIPFDTPLRIDPQPATNIPGSTSTVQNMSGNAEQNVSAANTNLAALNGSPPTFPREGIFIIQVQLPNQPVRNEYIDFFTANPTGTDFDLDDFRDHFIQRFADLLPQSQGGLVADGEHQLELEITPAGAINVRTMGFQAGMSSVTVGATTLSPSSVNLNTLVPHLSPASPRVLANSAIFGAQADSSTLNSAWLTSHPPVPNLASYNTLGLNQTAVWTTVPNLTWTYSVQERVQNVSTGVWEWQTVGSQSFHTNNGTTIDGASQFARDSVNTTLFTPPSASSPNFGGTLSADRDGNIYTNISFTGPSMASSFQPDLTNAANISQPGYRLVMTAPSPPTTVLARTGATALASHSVPSTYVARVSEREGELEITIGNVVGAAVSPVSVTVDFTAYEVKLPNGTSVPFTNTPASMATAIETALNNPIFHPNPMPRNGLTPADYDAMRPVARVNILPAPDNRLQITASERQFSIDVNERRSDKPMFLNTRQRIQGHTTNPTSLSVTYSHYGTPTTRTIPIAASNYTHIDEFITLNQAAFNNQGFTLSNTSGRLTITTTLTGAEVEVFPSR
jgi:hypothetical protein